ncbi:MAG: Ldh family oxidoreductase [Thalassobaculum sp.]|uniref:Ldh family oxidoreductase n=1 Tax=Thalassobaculum sp. TaxID=2022740 RepID=UPI0032EF0B2E
MTNGVKREGSQALVPSAGMEALGRAIFAKAGCSPEEADRIARRLTGANLRGHDSHGVIRIPRYVQWIGDGVQVPNQTVTLLLDQPSFAIVDGRYGFGQSIGEQTVDIGIARAKKRGVAVTALRNSGHLGRIGDWAERAAAQNIVSIHMVNVRGSLLVAPYGSLSRRMGTSPFCAGIPVAGGEPIILDFATSLVAEGKALVALKGGKPLPHGSLVDGDGNLTADPSPLYGTVPPNGYPDANNGPGALRAFGDHKGSGMNFLMEMMAGALGGSGTAGAIGEPKRRRFCNGMFSFYVDAAAFDTENAFAAEVKSYVDFVKSATPTTPGGEVLVPGEKERATLAERTAKGLPLAVEAWDDILNTARKLGIGEADIEAAVGGPV